MLGETLSGKYELVRLLGQGGMGSVYEARTPDMRRVAVKIINPELKSEAVLARFEREGQVASALDTPHIVRLVDTGTDDRTGAPFLVLELLDGEDLSQLLNRLGPLPPGLALRIIAQACLGLQKAHEAGVTHRDIKPANLFLAKADGAIVVKVLDFGIAKLRQAHVDKTEATGLTRTGSMLGTPLYMSPEQARGIKKIDHRTDIWSLGVVLYRALSGRTPNEYAEGFGDLITAIISEPPRSVQEFAPWVPPEIVALTHRALQQDPNERYQTPAEMLDAIRALLPDGFELREDMLVALSGDVRSTPAPKLELSTTGSRGRRGPGSAPTADAAPTVALRSAEAKTDEPAVLPPAPAKPASRAPVLTGAAIAAVLAGLGLYRSLAAGKPEAPSALGATLATTPTSPAPTTTPAPETRRVNLVVLPDDVSVEVDGTAARPRAGVVQIDGVPGSMHHVRLFKGSDVTEGDVVVSEAGAVPPKMELAVGKPMKDALAPTAAKPAAPEPSLKPGAAPPPGRSVKKTNRELESPF